MTSSQFAASPTQSNRSIAYQKQKAAPPRAAEAPVSSVHAKVHWLGPTLKARRALEAVRAFMAIAVASVRGSRDSL
jgi:hypothetical protein